LSIIAKLRIFSEIRKLEKNFEVVDAEDTAVADAAAPAGGKDFWGFAGGAGAMDHAPTTHCNPAN